MIFDKEVMAQPFGFTDLNLATIEWEKRHGFAPPAACPFPEDPDMAMRMVRWHHLRLGIKWSIDGWMQDRTRIRRGTYLEKDKLFLHLGIDLNVEAYTAVNAAADGIVKYVGDDTPLVGGWGGHIVQEIQFRGRWHALIYAHLGNVLVSQGERVRKGQRVGQVGNKSQNGFWRPHLHLQLVNGIERAVDWNRFTTDEIDGYGKLGQLVPWSRRCPDPTSLIFS